MAYAMTTLEEVIETQILPSSLSALVAKVVALMRACETAKDQTANIYTDSKHAVEVVQDYGPIKKNRSFTIAARKSIQSWKYV